MRQVVSALLVAMSFVTGVNAEPWPDAVPSSDWANVIRLQEGARVTVIDGRGRRYSGILEDVDNRTIHVRQRRTTANVLRDDVKSVSVRDVTGTSKRRAIWSGAAKTGATGAMKAAPIGVLLGGAVLLASGVLCAGLGAAIAAKQPARPVYRERVVYVRP